MYKNTAWYISFHAYALGEFSLILMSCGDWQTSSWYAMSNEQCIPVCVVYTKTVNYECCPEYRYRSCYMVLCISSCSRLFKISLLASTSLPLFVLYAFKYVFSGKIHIIYGCYYIKSRAAIDRCRRFDYQCQKIFMKVLNMLKSYRNISCIQRTFSNHNLFTRRGNMSYRCASNGNWIQPEYFLTYSNLWSVFESSNVALKISDIYYKQWRLLYQATT